MTTATSPVPKPRILCLHGGGTSGQIFELQTIRLRRLLPTHAFVFVSAPFESAAGPGVLPFFEDMPPYFRWRRGGRGAAIPATDEELEAAQRDDDLVDELLDDILAGGDGLGGEVWEGETAAEDGPRGPFVGVLGFSQGAGVAARLLLRQEERRRARDQGEGHEMPAERYPPLKFGVLIGGSPQCLYSKTRPPPKSLAGLDMARVRAAHEAEALGDVKGEGEREWSGGSGQEELSIFPRISTPTMHVHGRSDQYLFNARMLLKKFFVPATAQLLEFDGGHHMPVLPKDSQQVADMIVRAS